MDTSGFVRFTASSFFGDRSTAHRQVRNGDTGDVDEYLSMYYDRTRHPSTRSRPFSHGSADTATRSFEHDGDLTMAQSSESDDDSWPYGDNVMLAVDDQAMLGLMLANDFMRTSDSNDDDDRPEYIPSPTASQNRHRRQAVKEVTTRFPIPTQLLDDLDDPQREPVTNGLGSLGRLPPELLMTIVRKVGLEWRYDLITLGRASRGLRSIAMSDRVWEGAAGKAAPGFRRPIWQYVLEVNRLSCTVCRVALHRHHQAHEHCIAAHFGPKQAASRHGKPTVLCDRCHVAITRVREGKLVPLDTSAQRETHRRQMMLLARCRSLFGVTWCTQDQFALLAPKEITWELRQLVIDFVFDHRILDLEGALASVVEYRTMLLDRYAELELWWHHHEELRGGIIYSSLTQTWRSLPRDAFEGGLPLAQIGVVLSRRAHQVIAERLTQNAGDDDPSINYNVAWIVAQNVSEQSWGFIPHAIGEQLHSLPRWIRDSISDSRRPLSCLRADCSLEATSGCPCALCHTHCTPRDRMALGYCRRARCPVHSTATRKTSSIKA
ncbi:hypothetical protein E5Q_04393 [Mixia osmundae IAM 14324]|uniref:C2H2-type domain-containing protein n=1 Tax=Mixia osmundae (strain CBS 9802 / IAM 14324 / JCM 22182 / KY 12970) TaxID=764103 RepID=G7E4F4_MIXOS|nr:hypothetical protein E5Q_04393 [Mixia osmundae IAM 14324]